FNVGSFQRGNPERRSTLAVLKGVAESAKIELSRTGSTIAMIETLRRPTLDDDGREIEADVIISREEYEALITPLVERTVSLSRTVLARHPEVAIESVLMVGGPTLTPLVRRLVGEGLGVGVNTSANPLTVVAEGAALYAASQPLPRRVSTASHSGLVTLDVTHKSVTDDDSVIVGCPVPPDIASLEFVASDQSWSSGQLPVSNGRVMTRLPLPRKGTHEFQVLARSVDGTIVESEPKSISITRGLTAAPPPLPRSLGVVIDDGSGDHEVRVIIPRNAPLPARGREEFRTTIALEPGGEIEIIEIHVVEGESNRPERNRRVGSVIITDRHVSRRVPAGNPVEVTIEVSESRLLAAQAYVPLIDQTFDAKIQLGTDIADVAGLDRTLSSERERLANLAEHLPASTTRELHEDMREVETEIRAVGNADPETGQRALRNLQRVQSRIDEFEDSQRLPRAITEAREEAELATSVVMDFGDDSHRARLRALIQDLDEAIVSSSLREIKRVASKLFRLRFEILTQQPEWWVGYFNYMCNTVRGWTDTLQAEALMRQGRAEIVREDILGLRETCMQLRRLIRPEDEELVNRFQNVGIRKS
ncbi:MAG: Hsp70 family protein, partial [Dehalococcoidia bacterium]